VKKNTPGTHKAKTRNPRKAKATKAATGGRQQFATSAGRRAAGAGPGRKSGAGPGRKSGAPTPGVFGRPLPAPPPLPTARDTQRHQASQESAVACIEAALDKKALVPVLLDVSGRATYTDFICVVSGRSDRQVDAIAEHVREVMSRRGSRLLGREGTGNGRWTLLDFGDVVLHVFYHPVREVYDIEGLWIDAPRVALQVPPEAQLYQADALYGAL
jgi:ribosome-associated protein